MKLVVPCIILIPGLLAAGTPADPQQLPVAHQEIVVTASAAPELVRETPASVTVINREEIERSASRDLGELLRRVPGLTLARSGSAGKLASLFTRGGSSKHTLVLWNGIEVNNPFFSGYDFGHFSTAGIDRVEVVRGPFSALYGSDAVSGVINVLTNPGGTFASAELQGGGRGLRNGRIGGAGGSGGWHASGSLEARRDDGFAPNDDLEQKSGVGDLRFSGSAGWAAGARLRLNEYETGIPRVVDGGGSGFIPSLERRESAEEIELAVPIQFSRGRTQWEVLASRADRKETFEDPLDPFARLWAETDVETSRASVTARVDRGRHMIVAGGEWESASVDDASSYGTNLESRSRTGRGVFVEDRASLPMGRGALEVSAGTRYDSFDTFGGHLSPRASAAFLIGRQKIRAGWGEAFRAPAIGELYFPFFGNPDLEPERSTSWELGWDGESEAGRISATLFSNDFDQLIVYDNVRNRFENVGAGRADGLEVGAETALGERLRIAASWTWLRTEEQETGLPFLRRPEQSGSLSARWSSGPWAAGASLVHVGERADLTDLFPWGRVTADAYTTADLVLERRIGADVVPFVKVENAVDETYEEVFGYPSPGRRAIVGVRVQVGR
ncbi:MAG TPA: TonB-dependent receptor [Thermoanaerobaculia bacterium]|nr:TonB-dependent receptor [Thermoanaerobaculia bacterium]